MANPDPDLQEIIDECRQMQDLYKGPAVIEFTQCVISVVGAGQRLADKAANNPLPPEDQRWARWRKPKGVGGLGILSGVLGLGAVAISACGLEHRIQEWLAPVDVETAMVSVEPEDMYSEPPDYDDVYTGQIASGGRLW